MGGHEVVLWVVGADQLTSSIALRQYHFTALDMGGWSESSSADVFQQMSWCSASARVMVPFFGRAQ